jgi:4-diphosphocytidyl-2-C-methyl-D-erythritol kinase
MRVTLRSYSKINLGLAIGPVRPDRFHALATVYQTIDAHDLVTVELLPSENAGARIEITTDHPQVPTDARNTVFISRSGCLCRAAWAAVQPTRSQPSWGWSGCFPVRISSH